MLDVDGPRGPTDLHRRGRRVDVGVPAVGPRAQRRRLPGPAHHERRGARCRGGGARCHRASATRSTGWSPAPRYCFAVIAVGPEGAADSRPTEHQCVTTAAPSALAAPEALVLTPEGGGDVSLQWTHPDPTGVEFAVLVNNTRQPELIVGLGTRITLPQRDTPQEYQIAVQAIRGEETSDPTPAQPVTVEALPIDATTTVAAPTTTGPGATVPQPLPPPPTDAGRRGHDASRADDHDHRGDPGADRAPGHPHDGGGVPRSVRAGVGRRVVDRAAQERSRPDVQRAGHRHPRLQQP